MANENLFIIDTDLIDNAERAARELAAIIPGIENLAHQDRRNATEDAVAELGSAVASLTALLRQITDGLLSPDATFGEINSRQG